MNKILHFRWLMIHYALLVGDLMRGSVTDRSCVMCGYASESLHHVFWECVVAKKFWFRILRLLGRKYRSGIFTWGAVLWGRLDQQMTFYHQHYSSLSLHVTSLQVTILQPHCRESSFSPGVMSGKLSPLWLYGFFGKLGVLSYTMMKTRTSWIRLSLFGTYWYIQLKVNMIVIRVMDTKLIRKE